MELTVGFVVVILAGFFQGAFMIPLSLEKKWQWENGWAMFSILGMAVLNWLIALAFIPGITDFYAAIPTGKLVSLCLIGIGWGCGAVLFGIGMERLGLSLGYPIIQGLIAMCGALIPLLLLMPEQIITVKGITLIVGAVVVITGISVCSRAGARKFDGVTVSDPDAEGAVARQVISKSGIIIAVAAGILSSFPNVAASLSNDIVAAAKASGVSDVMAGNAVWPLFFTCGLVPNLGYTVYLFIKNRTFGSFKYDFGKNFLWSLLMSAMWIGSFYLYGIGANRMGEWGLVIGWPLNISFAIITGNLCGLWRGEWNGADGAARKMLNVGIATVVLGMVIIGVCNFF